MREALAILEHEALIGSRNGRGLYVRPLTREEFVGMLSINNWQPVSRFSQLEKLRIPSLRDGGRFEAQHCS